MAALDGLVALVKRQDEEPPSPPASRDGFDLDPPEARGAVHEGEAGLGFGGLVVGVTGHDPAAPGCGTGGSRAVAGPVTLWI